MLSAIDRVKQSAVVASSPDIIADNGHYPKPCRLVGQYLSQLSAACERSKWPSGEMRHCDRAATNGDWQHFQKRQLTCSCLESWGELMRRVPSRRLLID